MIWEVAFACVNNARTVSVVVVAVVQRKRYSYTIAIGVYK